MITEYVERALERARYKIIEDREPYFGEIPACRGVWATIKTLEKCRRNLRETLEGWLLVRVQQGLPIPRIGGKTIVPPVRMKVIAALEELEAARRPSRFQGEGRQRFPTR